MLLSVMNDTKHSASFVCPIHQDYSCTGVLQIHNPQSCANSSPAGDSFSLNQRIMRILTFQCDYTEIICGVCDNANMAGHCTVR
ncbi:hypothetical protein CEXT_424861 [Caerostris extrusa]|uniref:Uncharacterized protein n=1 Tax=Caerostris extrusa TaxID=172846 RepID=A0AAV4W7W3_CAEEX|nr:hypothetical protein CEXT_424861 [Caerostris extrusa]